MGYMFLLLLVIGIVIVMVSNTSMIIKSHPWNHLYEGIQLSTTDFYSQVETGLRDRKIEGLKYGKESFLQSHIFSVKREYLRITQGEYVFFVCAAPFGTGTFISWWLCVKDERIINRIPVLNKLAGKDRANKSFYQMDTEAMYQSVVHSTVVSVADSLTAERGIRLTELERMYKGIGR